MNNPGYLVGWDGGGTKTAMELRDLQGNVRYRGEAGALNPNGGVQGQMQQTAEQLLRQMREYAPLEECRMLCIGAAGVSNPETERSLRHALCQGGYSGPVKLVGDHQTALCGALGKLDGAILIAGTGSICYGALPDGRDMRCGGWGSLMDDEGGGYALGRDILSAVVREKDGRMPPTHLTDLVFEHLQITEMQQLMAFVYGPKTGKREIAALAPLLTPALERGDQAALKIVDKAVRELAFLVDPVVNALHMQSGELALMGSVLNRNQWVRTGLEECLKQRWPNLRCVRPQMDAAAGASLLALMEWKKQGGI